MKKTVVIVILTVLILESSILCSSCSQNNNSTAGEFSEVTTLNSIPSATIYANGERNITNFEEDVQNSSGIIVAEMIEKSIDHDSTYCYKFKILDILFGYFDNDIINVHVVPTGEISHEKGKRYILMLYKVDLVFYQNPRYYSVADYDIQINETNEFTVFNKGGQVVNEFAKPGDYLPFIQLIADIKRSQPSTQKTLDLQGNFVRSADLKTILNHSTFVARVIPRTAVITGFYSELYECDILEVYKGSLPEKVRIHFFPGIVQDQELLVMLVATSPTEAHTTYTVSSAASQFPVNSDQYKTFQDLIIDNKDSASSSSID